MWFDIGAPNQTSACGLFFSASNLANAGPEDRKMYFTSIPVSFEKAFKIFLAFASSTLLYMTNSAKENTNSTSINPSNATFFILKPPQYNMV